MGPSENCWKRFKQPGAAQAKEIPPGICFEAFDQPNAYPLPQRPYEYAEWRVATVNIDYHIEVEHHYYSVSYRLLREKLDVRLTAATVEALLKGERVAAHVRSFIPYGHTTLKEHMPPSHQKYFGVGLPSRMV